MNKVVLDGILERFKPIPTKHSDNTGLRFTVVVQRENKPDWTDKLDAIAWGEPAKLAATINAGARIRVEGRLQRSSWQDKNTGERKYSTEVNVTRIGLPRDTEPADDDKAF